MNDARTREALAVCAEITRTQARNFYYGLRLLPQSKRDALYAVYAWMRVADDIADEEGLPAETRLAQLDALARDTRRALAGEAIANAQKAQGGVSHGAVFVALSAVAARYPLPSDDFDAAILGQRMDLAPRVYATFAETELYCDRVASTVGRICLAVWGLEPGADAARARTLATARGVAFQLTNILRDIREDHARGRCYLPADELAANGLSAADLVAWRDPERCARFMEFQCSRAARIYGDSAALDGLVERDARPTIAAMSAIYRGILREVARDPAQAMRRRARLSAFAKSWIALRARLGLLGSGGDP